MKIGVKHRFKHPSQKGTKVVKNSKIAHVKTLSAAMAAIKTFYYSRLQLYIQMCAMGAMCVYYHVRVVSKMS